MWQSIVTRAERKSANALKSRKRERTRSPCSRVPNEILTVILEHAVQSLEHALFIEIDLSAKERLHRELRQTLVSVTSVSRTWRTVSLDDSSLWTTVLTPWIPDCSSEEKWVTEKLEQHINLVLNRRRHHPLSIFEAGYAAHRSLSECLYSHDLNKHVKAMFLCGNSERVPDPSDLFWYGTYFARLAELDINGWNTQHINRFLTFYDDIRTLTLKRCFQSHMIQPRTLPLLARLTLLDFWPGEAARWAEHIDAPQLYTLCVITHHYDRKAAQEPDENWFPDLRRFRYSPATRTSIRRVVLGDLIARYHAKQVLRDLPKVTELEFSYSMKSNIPENTLELLWKEDREGQLICPVLEVLSYRNASITEVDLLRVLETRRRRSESALGTVRLSNVNVLYERKRHRGLAHLAGVEMLP